MKVDMHVHTRFSKDSRMDPEELVEEAEKKGLDGIVVTDHDTMEGFRGAEKLDSDVTVVPGEEITTDKGELLGLFLDKEIENSDPEKVVKEVKEQDGIVVVPHPFDPIRSFDGWKELEGIDGLEVFNSRNLTSGMNKKAKEYAEKKSLIKTAGSDAHSPWEVGKAYVEAEAKSIEEFKEELIDSGVKVNGTKGSILSYIHGNLEKIKHGLRRR
ncbi:MAG: CehA/McbA family metallohydrolase [Candidatus Aenigmatarchaeota archaeon]